MYDEAIRGLLGVLEGRGVEIQALQLTSVTVSLLSMGRLLWKPPAVLATLGSAATRWATKVLRLQSMACGMTLDPFSLGITGASVSLDPPAADKLRLLRGLFPSLRRIGVIHTPGRCAEAVRELEALRAGGEPILLVQARNAAGLRHSLADLRRRADALLMLPDASLYDGPASVARLLRLASRRRLPVVGVSPTHVRAGALVAIHGSPEDNGRRLGGVVMRILSGEKARDIPPQQTLKVLWDVNPAVARDLGLRIHESAAETPRSSTQMNQMPPLPTQEVST